MYAPFTANEDDAQTAQVLNHWQVFVLRPMGPCFLPRPGPNYRIFIGLSEQGSRIVRTDEIVAFDAWTWTGKCASGARYRLGPKVGFTEDMRAWFKRRHYLAAAGAGDVTQSVLALVRDVVPGTVHMGSSRIFGDKR